MQKNNWYSHYLTRPQMTPLKLHSPSMLPDKAKSVVCSIISLALSFWMKHLVIGQLQKNCKILGFSLFNISKSGFHWSAFGNQQGSIFTEANIFTEDMVLLTISDA